MAPTFWMITNREVKGKDKNKDLGRDVADLSHWVSDGGDLTALKNWKPVSAANFDKLLLGAADKFPKCAPEDNEGQKHVTLFVHGYNNDWKDAVKRYQTVCKGLFEGPDSMGLCVLFNWPSDGMKLGYYPDRADARRSAPHLAAVLNRLYDALLERQHAGVENPAKACRAKVSLIAHSMGNYLLQKAMQYTWSRANQPLLVSLITQLLMVAADVDNDLFKGGETTDQTDGDAIANLTYRITALYTSRDNVLGMSAGLKHFGKRRLGRSGLHDVHDVPDNVWHFDCTRLIPPKADNIHSFYFDAESTYKLMRLILKGLDRHVIEQQYA
jgi:Uncharacterized protein conserved in bacteria